MDPVPSTIHKIEDVSLEAPFLDIKDLFVSLLLELQ